MKTTYALTLFVAIIGIYFLVQDYGIEMLFGILFGISIGWGFEFHRIQTDKYSLVHYLSKFDDIEIGIIRENNTAKRRTF